MQKSGEFVHAGMEKARKKISPAVIVLSLLLFIGLLVGIKMLFGEPTSAEAYAAAFVCPEAPAPFVLQQNLVADVDGQRLYIACAWVGGLPQEAPLP